MSSPALSVADVIAVIRAPNSLAAACNNPLYTVISKYFGNNASRTAAGSGINSYSSPFTSSSGCSNGRMHSACAICVIEFTKRV